jgi:hypothetical protein
MSNGRSGQPAAVAVKEREKDEDDILALVQANVVDQSAYEETVLRQATLATAPRLEITSSSSSATAGRFPMDDGVAAFEPHVILARIAETRRHLSVDPDNDRLHMKLQLLLQWSNHNRKPKNNKSGSAGRGQPPLSKKKKEEADTTTTTTTTRIMYEKLRRLEIERSKRLHDGNTTTKRPAEESSSNPVTTTAPLRKRVPMMKRKYANRMADDDDENENETSQSSKKMKKSSVPQKSKTELQRLRDERQKQRQDRQRRRGPGRHQQPDSDDDENGEFELGDENENDEDAKPAAKTTTIDLVDSSDHDDGDDDKNCVVCPDCRAKLVLTHDDDRDAALARHLSACGGSQDRRRSSTRRREDSSGRRSTRSSSSLRGEQPSTAPIAVGAPRSFSSSSTGQPPLDDWNAVDYEDRVEDWIQHGLDKMPVLDKLRDNADSYVNNLPGAVEYAGGLLVPAWINDRLFEYQRTGVQWMWELHQQYVGGIVGDEMGLGTFDLLCGLVAIRPIILV